MKKLAKFLAMGMALCIVMMAAQSQAALVGKGLKAGINFATWRGSDSKFSDPELSVAELSPESRTGIGGGVYLKFGIGTALYLQPEVLYTQKGAKYSATVDGTDVKVTMKLDYVEVPVLLKYGFEGASASSITPNLFAGPAVAFKASSKVKAEAGSVSAEADASGFKSVDFGLCFGGGLDFAVGENTMGLDVRYTLGLSSIDDSATSADVKNGAWMVTASYGF
jgi:hypothetical protein